MENRYYEAYDQRYQQVHSQNLQWASDRPTPIVEKTIEQFRIPREAPILELGCGEGRDAGYLLGKGRRVLATDISREAVDYCRSRMPESADAFQVLDCVQGKLEQRFSFIYGVAVLHMLVRDADRDGFYRFFREHLAEDGIGLICSMGDGEMEMRSDIATAFDVQKRTHQASGKTLMLAGTSCRMVCFDTFRQEIARNGLQILEQGITSAEPDFDSLMYAVVKRK